MQRGHSGAASLIKASLSTHKNSLVQHEPRTDQYAYEAFSLFFQIHAQTVTHIRSYRQTAEQWRSL